MLRMGIVGHGFVGRATDYGFQRDVVKCIVDPNYNTTIKDLERFAPDVVFVCVPTPMTPSGKIDDSIIQSVITDLNKFDVKPIVVIKSTVHPGVLAGLDYPYLVYNPEFLTERNANHDFVNSKMIVIGGDMHSADFVEKIYKENSIVKECPIYRTDIAGASMVKYSINCFLALKVAFMNQLKDTLEETDSWVSWDYFTNILATDPRIGNSHMQVPGPDKRKGFGGACFTKDTAAMVAYTENMSILEEAIAYNNKVRSQYEELDEREKEQNVVYLKK